MKVLDEIKKVGFSNWVWWVFYCERNEFHPRLNIDSFFAWELEQEYGKEEKVKYINAQMKKRQHAHHIDMEIG